MSGTPDPGMGIVPMVDGRFVDTRAGALLVLILSCDKYRSRADGIRNSWLKLAPPNHRVLFVHGRPGSPARIEGDKLYVDCLEAYEKLPLKVHLMLRFALKELEFDHLFKTDDDTFLDLERFIHFNRERGDYIGQFRENPVGEIGKTWHYGKCDDKSLEKPYDKPFVCPWATGGGYFLSRRAAARVLERTVDTSRSSLFEDMMVGEALTADRDLSVVRSLFSEMGVINPLLPKDMLYVQSLLLEKRELALEVRRLRAENDPPADGVLRP